MTPAAVAIDVAYSLLLDGSGLPPLIAHDAFLRVLDEPEPDAPSTASAGDATKEAKRAALAAGIAARGEDAHTKFNLVGSP